MPNPKYDGAAGQIAPGEEAEDVNLGASIPPMAQAPPYHMGESLNQEFRPAQRPVGCTARSRADLCPGLAPAPQDALVLPRVGLFSSRISTQRARASLRATCASKG